jgi:hypothetical protein
MIMKRNRSFLWVALLPAALVAACSDSNDATSPSFPPQVQELRASLDPYTSLTLAKAAGYNTAITDCLSNGDEGAMGIHFANPALIDGVSDRLHPEALIYEPGASGEMSLVGVEFIIPFAVLPKTSPAPTLLGQSFMPIDAFGVWGLHVWTHRTNPKGTFAMWNPRVHC